MRYHWGMTDIAQLGIAVDTSQTAVAVRELNKMADAGGKAEASTKSLGNASRQAMSEVAASTARAAAAAEKMLASQERQERMMQQVAMQIGGLTNAMGANTAAQNAMAKAAQDAADALTQQSSASKAAGTAAAAQAASATNAAAATGQMGAQATAASAAMGGLHSRIIATVGAVVSLNKVVQEMDAWTNMNNRIKLVTETQGQFTQAQANILQIANSTRQPLKETAELYQRLATSQKVLGLSGDELAGVVKTVSQSMVISGSSAQAGAAALMQLGQAFNEGVLRGENFNSVMEQAPGLAKAIAEGMGRTVGELRGLAEAGKITTEEVVKALQKQAGSVEENFGKMGATVGQALTVSANKFTEFVGRADEATGVSKALSGAIIGLSDNMGPLATMTGALVAAGLATWLTSAATAAGGFGVAATAAGVAVRGLLASIGPAGWLILGLGAAATAWQLLGDKSTTAGNQMSAASDQATAAANKLTAGIVPALNQAIAAYDKMLNKQREAMGTAKTPIEEMSKQLKDADINLQKLAQQVARAQQGAGEYVNMGPQARAAAEKALTKELEEASKKRGELAKKEAEYNSNLVTQYVKGKERQTDASQKLLDIEKAKEARDKAMAAAGADRAQQDRVNAAYRMELAKIEEDYAKKGAGAAKTAAREAKQAAKDQSDALSDLSGVSKSYYKDLENYQKQLKAGVFTEERYVAAVEKLIQKQPFATKLAKEAADAWKEQEKARKDAYKVVEKAFEDEVKGAERSAQAVTNKVAQMQIENEAALAMQGTNLSLAQSIEKVMIARLEEQKAHAKATHNQELLDAINAEIEARKQLIEVTGTKEARDASDKAAKEAAKDWKKTADDINKTLTDALMRGFEDGKGFAENMRDAIVNMFKTMVLKPVIQAIIQPVVGGITGMFGTSGAAQAAQAGGGLLGGAGNIASLAGSLGSFGTALGAGASMATSGLAGFTAALEGGVAMLGSATGFSSAMAGIGQLAGALGPVALGVTALASIFSQRATPHTGGVAQYSAAGGLQASNQGGMFNTGFSAVHYGEEAIKTVASLAKAVVTELDKTALSFGREAGYEMAAAFADDASKDPAWGALRISQGGRDIVNWSEDTSKWLQREFADGEKGLEEFMNAVAKDVVTVLKDMDLPGWAGRFTKAMPDDASMEQVNTLLATLREYPNKLLEIAGTSRDALAGQFTEGLMAGNAAQAGQSVANTLVASIEQSMMGAAAGQIFDIVNRGIVTPMIDALLTGQSVTEALSDAAIADVVAKATATAQALGAIMNSQEFQGALSTIKTSVGAALGSAGAAFSYTPRYQSPVVQEPTQAQDAASKAAEDLAKKIQDAINGVKADNLQLQIDLLRENGDEAAAALMELNRETEGWSADKREEYRLLLQENAIRKEELRIAQSVNAMRKEGASLQIELLKALGKNEEALNAERDIAIAKMSELEVAQYDANQATRKLIQGVQSLQSAFDDAWNALATPEQQRQRSYAGALTELGRNGVNATMEQAIGASSADILQFIGHVSQLGDVSAETRANIIRAATSIAELNKGIRSELIAGAQELLSKLNTDTIKRINDEADAKIKAWDKERTIAQERQGIEQTALQLTGNTIELRRRELSALDATNQALQQRVWAVQDAESGMDKALALVQRSVNAEKQRISESAQAQIDAINAEQEARKTAIDAAQKAIGDLQGLFDSITDTVKTLRGNVLTEQQNMERARAYIAMSLSVARAGGDVNADRLQEAMQTVSGDTAQTYVTGAEYRYQQARQAAVLDELGGIVGGRLSGAKTQLEALNTANTIAQDQIKAITEARDAQIKALDAQLKAAEDAVSVAKGVDISVIGVDDSITDLHSAIAVYENARDTLDRENLSVGYEANRLLTSQIDNANLLREQELKDWELRHTEAANQLTALGKIDTSILSLQSAMSGIASGLQAQAAAQQAAAAAAQAIATASMTSYQQVDMVSSGGPVPSFDVGTNYVPSDMVAQIHKGEAIVPEKFNPAIFNQGNANNADLVNLVATLTDEVKRLQNLVREGNSEQRRTAEAVNGRPEAPMLVEVA